MMSTTFVAQNALGGATLTVLWVLAVRILRVLRG